VREQREEGQVEEREAREEREKTGTEGKKSTVSNPLTVQSKKQDKTRQDTLWTHLHHGDELVLLLVHGAELDVLLGQLGHLFKQLLLQSGRLLVRHVHDVIALGTHPLDLFRHDLRVVLLVLQLR
jgi:hypothetical protein